ncbi:unnamed protein product [Protopolystoma xenopodis]|uniref:FH2 domain-containing protein n=1 Tax=Protopolystoma xenopodis TaxID=117903 RepID=A0A3S5CMR2_9PLAT|nr:unnamed protein product [Protopolystoma xenopodis]
MQHFNFFCSSTPPIPLLRNQPVCLLESQRCLNINIFLRQFKMLETSVIDLLRTGSSRVIGPERLRGLLKLLPNEHELQVLKGYSGSRIGLDPAEQFFIDLVRIPE